jgi:hypothetical protein
VLTLPAVVLTTHWAKEVVTVAVLVAGG